MNPFEKLKKETLLFYAPVLSYHVNTEAAERAKGLLNKTLEEIETKARKTVDESFRFVTLEEADGKIVYLGINIPHLTEEQNKLTVRRMSVLVLTSIKGMTGNV